MIDRTLTADKIPFVQAKWYRRVRGAAPATGGRVVRWIVMHSMEAPEGPQTAENVARYFADGSGGRPASAHYCVDADSIVQCVQTRDVAFAAPNANRNGVHIELAGYARQTRAEWLDAYSTATLHNAAYLCGLILCPKFSIPAVFLAAPQLDLRESRGFTTHLEVTRAFNPGGHTDPGEGFPMDLFLGWVGTVLKGGTLA